MNGFKILLSVLLIAVVVYTIPVVLNHGPNLFPQFFGDIAKMGWAGQFNVDFMGFLVLSGLWMAWRHHFSVGGLLLGVIGFFGGIPALAIYLLIQMRAVNGDIAQLMLGKARADAIREGG